MKTLLIVLLVLWLAVAVLGFVLEALLWLAALGLILFALTALYWYVRVKRSRGAEQKA